MKLVKKILKLGLVVIVIIIFTIFAFMKNKDKMTVEIWDNIYNENNIVFFYSDVDDPKLKVIKELYRLDELVKGEKGELDKALKVVSILSEKIAFDDVGNSKGINGYDILKEKGDSKKASSRDLAIIYRDLISSIGYTARVGEFRNIDTNISKQTSYYIVEYWSSGYNKWIMIDFIDKGYFDDKGFPCSAMELLEKDIRNLNYSGESNRRDYIPKIKRIANTYTIMIDNTTDMKKSNTFISYIKKDKDITMKFKGGYLQPTIFTENKDLFNKNPMDKEIGKDEKAYIILMKKTDKELIKEDEKLDKKEGIFIIGGFKDGKILDKCYIKEKGGEFREVKRYSDILIEKGTNDIGLSLDGENVISKIEIEYK